MFWNSASPMAPLASQSAPLSVMTQKSDLGGGDGAQGGKGESGGERRDEERVWVGEGGWWAATLAG